MRKTLISAVFALLCVSAPLYAADITLEKAVEEAAARLGADLPAGRRVIITKFESEDIRLTNYIIDALTGHLVRGGKVKVVTDRANIERLTKELEYQESGMVREDTEQAIGKQLAAQTMLFGSLVKQGKNYRLQVTAAGIESAINEAAFSSDVSAEGAFFTSLRSGAPPASALTPKSGASQSGKFSGAWNTVVAYKQGGADYNDRYAFIFYDDNSCDISITAKDGKTQTGEGYWQMEDGIFKLEADFWDADIPRLKSVQWKSVYLESGGGRQLKVNIKPAPDYAGVTGVTLNRVR